MKRAFVCILAGVLVIAAVWGSSVFIKDTLLNDEIKNITISENGSAENVLTIQHGRAISKSAAYSVRVLDKEEPEYAGRRLVENDGSLGAYRMEILFYDVTASEKLANRYPAGEVHPLQDADQASAYKIRLAYPPDDALFAVYIGSNQPINIKDQDITPIDKNEGRIRLAMEK